MLPVGFSPAVGENQTFLRLVVLHSAELSSAVSEQRNLLPHPMSLSKTERVPIRGPSSISPTAKSSR